MNKLNKIIDNDDFINNEYPKFCSAYNYVPAILPKTRRIIAIGDIHGDFNLAIKLSYYSFVIAF
jgi:hypothetical protein